MRQIASETLDLGSTYVYRGFVVNWRVSRLACLRPAESEITREMRNFFVWGVSPGFHENSHTMLDGCETVCLAYEAPMSQTEVMALIDRFWSEAMSGAEIRERSTPNNALSQDATSAPLEQ